MDTEEKENNQYNNIEIDKDILESVLRESNSFDNKAGIVISVMGVVLGLSLTFIERFDEFKSEKISYCCFMILYILYILASIISISYSIFVIYPFYKKLHFDNAYEYDDLSKMKFEDYKKNKEEYFKSEKIIFDQIKEYSFICKEKHRELAISIKFMFTSLTLILVITVVYFLLKINCQ